jgi:hypothetical protein
MKRTYLKPENATMTRTDTQVRLCWEGTGPTPDGVVTYCAFSGGAILSMVKRDFRAPESIKTWLLRRK